MAKRKSLSEKNNKNINKKTTGYLHLDHYIQENELGGLECKYCKKRLCLYCNRELEIENDLYCWRCHF